MSQFDDFLDSDSEFAVFCGAGVSADSGIPMVLPLVKAFLQEIADFSDTHINAIRDQWQFEAFMGKVLKAFPLQTQDILSTFDDRKRNLEPGPIHWWIADQVLNGRVKVIYTTNFDRLIEATLDRKVGVDSYEVLYHDAEDSEYSLTRSGTKLNKPTRIVKLHGCISDKESIAVTMQNVLNHIRIPTRDKAIDALFSSSTFTHREILFLGYSVSDEFDVVPKLKSIAHMDKHIIFVNHAQDIKTTIEKGLRLVERLDGDQDKPPHNPFQHLVDNHSLWTEAHTAIALGADSRKPSIPESWETVLSAALDSAHKANRDIAAAWLYYDLGDMGKATYHYNEIISNKSVPDDEPLILGLTYEGLGEIDTKLGELDSAREYFSKAEAIYQSADLKFECAGIQHSQAKLLMDLGQYDEAEELLERSREGFESIGSQFGVATTLGTLGVLDGAERGNHTRALKNLLTAHQYFCDHGYIQSRVTVEFRLGSNALISNNLSEARERFRSATYLAQKQGLKNSEGLGLSYQALLAKQEGDTEQCLQLYSQSIKILEAIGNAVQAAKVSNDLATVFRTLGQRKKALDMFIKAKEIAEKTGNNHFIALMNNNVGSIYQSMGEVDQALSYYQEAEQLLRSIGDILDLAVNLVNQGMIHEHLQDHRLAGMRYFEATNIAISCGDNDIISRCFLSLGNYWRQLGMADLALEHYHHAEHFHVSKETLAVLRNNYGIVLELKEELEEATPFFAEAIDIAREVELYLHLPTFLQSLAINMEKRGLLIEAKTYAEEALASAEKYVPELLQEMEGELADIVGSN